MKSRILLLLVLTLIGVGARASNEITLSSASGHPGDLVTVTVSFQCEDEVSAVDIAIPLTAQTAYVDESCILAEGRSNGHIVSAAAAEGTLRILVYNLSLAPLQGSGALLSFQVKLGQQPGDYALDPSVTLSSEQGTALPVYSYQASIRILSPEICIRTSSIDFGRTAIHGSYTHPLTIQNSGNEPLTISTFQTSATELSVLPANGTIAAGDSAVFTVTYSPTIRASEVEEFLSITSNAVNGSQRVAVKAIPYSANELHVSSVKALCDSIVTIAITMDNMEPIVSAQFSFQLPDELTYITGGLSTGKRVAGHSVYETLNDGLLTFYIISTTNQPISDNEGELLSFQLKLNGKAGSYALIPKDIALSSASAENMLSGYTEGSVQIQAPQFVSYYSNIWMDELPITKTPTAGTWIYNHGDAELIINQITFDESDYSIEEELPLIIPAGEARIITIHYNSTKEGAYSTQMTLYTNDPLCRQKVIQVSGRLYEPNQLSFTVEPSADYEQCTFQATLSNYTEIVALQMDFHWLEGMTATDDDIVLSSRMEGHSASIQQIAPGVHRLVIFSLSNQPISGNSGRIFDVTFKGPDCGNTDFRVDSIILSSATGIDYTSPHANIYFGRVNVAVTSIVLNKDSATIVVDKKEPLSATIFPENATWKYLVWSSSDETIATVNSEGLVTAKALGEASITAKAMDDSNVSASCVVTVAPQLAENLTFVSADTSVVVDQKLLLPTIVEPQNTSYKTFSWYSDDESIATVNEKGIVTGVKVGRTKITATTIDGSNISTSCIITVAPQPVLSVSVGVDQMALFVGDSVALANPKYSYVSVRPQNATNKTLLWHSSDSNIATVDSSGMIRAVGVGRAFISASSTDGTNCSDSCLIIVAPRLAYGVSLSQTSINAVISQTYQLTAHVYPEDTTNQSIYWTSSDETIATVDSTGLVTAHALGTAIITVSTTDGSEKSSSCTVTVIPQLIWGMSLAPTDTTLVVGQTLQLVATVWPSYATNKKIKWTSSNPQFATVDSTGIVTAISPGGLRVTASATDGSELYADGWITVLPQLVDSIELSPSSASVVVDKTLQLSTIVWPNNATYSTLAWTSSNDSIASVDSTGLLTALKVGNVTITATATDGSRTTATCEISVLPQLVESLTLSLTSDSIVVNKTLQLSAIINPDNSTSKSLMWMSSDEQIATVDTTGLVTAKQVGTVQIIAIAPDGSNCTACCMITVLPQIVEDVSLSLISASVVVDQTLQLSATIEPNNATKQDVIWASSDEYIATVDSTGLVTAKQIGDVAITVSTTDGSNITKTCNVTVLPQVVESLTLSASTTNIVIDNDLQLYALIKPDNATTQTLVWTSSNDTIATVDSTGLVIAKQIGNVTITASTTDGSNISATCFVTIQPQLVETIELSQQEDSLMENMRLELSVIIGPENATNKTVLWASSDEHVATVDADGVVVALNEGQTTITATTTDGSQLYDSCIIVVTAIPNSTDINLISQDNIDRILIYSSSGLLIHANATWSYYHNLPPGVYIVVRGNQIIKLWKR